MSRRCDLVAWDCNTELADLKVVERTQKHSVATFMQPCSTGEVDDNEEKEKATDIEFMEKRKHFKITKRKL